MKKTNLIIVLLIFVTTIFSGVIVESDGEIVSSYEVLDKESVSQVVKEELNIASRNLLADTDERIEYVVGYGNDMYKLVLSKLRNYTILFTICMVLINFICMSLLFRWRIKKEQGMLLIFDEKLNELLINKNIGGKNAKTKGK